MRSGQCDCTYSSDTLSVWLHITDNCNLRCAYCYLPHHQAEMSVETGTAAIEAAFRSALKHGFGNIRFKYAGGEPLLCFDVVRKLHNYAQLSADKHGVSVEGIVLSNATLLSPEIVEQMLALKLRLMISLDGLGMFHDCQRPYADGQGTFTDISKAIDLAISYNLVPDISITLSGRNAEGLSDLIRWITNRNLPLSLNFYRENDFSSSEKYLRLEEDKIIKSVLGAYRVIGSDLPKLDHADFSNPHLRTCGVGQCYLVFDHQGRAAKCQMDIGNTITDIHHADPLSQLQKSNKGIQNISVEEKSGCRECEWRYYCAGGCPLLTYRATGHFNRKSPNCNIYKAIYPEIFLTESLNKRRQVNAE